MANFLSNLSPDWFNSVMGNSNPAPDGYAPPSPIAAPAALDGIGGSLAMPADAPITTVPNTQNMLQNLNVGAPPNDAPDATQPARSRSSLLDTIGRISDVFAKVGGANALYQPTLDARQDRTLSLGDHDRAVAMEKIKLADATGDLGDKGNTRLGNAVRGLQAITAANPQADISKIWPLLAAQAGVDPARAQTLGAQLAANPDMIKGLAGTVGATREFGLQPFYYTDKDGKLRAGQVSKDGTFQAIDLDGGVASDPTKAVNLGGTTALVGTRSGKVNDTLTNTVRPDTIANNKTKTDIANNRDKTQITVAGMPARAQPGKGGGKNDAAAGNSEALIALDNLENGFKDLHRLGALPGDNGGAVGNVLAAIGRTGPGQYLGEQAGSEAAQRRVAMSKTVNTLQQTLIKALPASATRTKFEQEILAKSLPDPTRMSLSTAQSVIGDYRAIFKRAQAAAAAETGGSGSGSRTLPPRLDASRPAAPASRAPVRTRPGKPSISNW